MLSAVLVAVGFALLPAVTPSAVSSETAQPSSLYAMSAPARALYGVVILATCACYCGGLWSGGRRTLAMKTWRLGLITSHGARPTGTRALLRFAACLVGPSLAVLAFIFLQPSGEGRWAAAMLPFNYAWAVVDRKRQFLQDRIADTRLVVVP